MARVLQIGIDSEAIDPSAPDVPQGTTPRLAQNEVFTGIIPGAGATAYLPRLLGNARALEVILGASPFDADTAERFGWVNRSLPADMLDDFVEQLARHIAGLTYGVIGAAKAAIKAAEGASKRSTAHTK